jgi:hypothetical protein
VNRHASAEELASLALGGLRRRKAARISAHLSTCIQCTQVNGKLGSVQTMLASASAQFDVSMPPDLSARVSGALTAVSNERLSSETPTEAGRRDLPQRSRASALRGVRSGRGVRSARSSGQSGPNSGRQPRWSMTTKVLAGAGAVAVIAVAGAAIGTQVGGPSSSTSAASSPGATNVPMTTGPKVSYQHAGATKTITEVKTSTDFQASTLVTQAKAAVTEARARGDISGSGAGAGATPAPTANSGPVSSPNASSMSGMLGGCVNRVAAGQSVILVESARYEGSNATIIVTDSSTPGHQEVWVVGSSCSSANSDVLDHATFATT